jgi:hypothetical protein
VWDGDGVRSPRRPRANHAQARGRSPDGGGAEEIREVSEAVGWGCRGAAGGIRRSAFAFAAANDSRLCFAAARHAGVTGRSQESGLAVQAGRRYRELMRVETEIEDDGRWIAEVPALPGAMAYGWESMERGAWGMEPAE